MTADRLHETLVRTIRNGGDTGRVRAFDNLRATHGPDRAEELWTRAEADANTRDGYDVTIPAGPIHGAPAGSPDAQGQRRLLVDALAAAGVELGDWDVLATARVTELPWTIVATVISWINRAAAGGAP